MEKFLDREVIESIRAEATETLANVLLMRDECLGLCEEALRGKDATEWRPLAKAPHCSPVLLAVERPSKARVVFLAYHIERFRVKAEYEEADCIEYRESDDSYYIEEGWYESNESGEDERVTAKPLGWMPLPKPPEAKL